MRTNTPVWLIIHHCGGIETDPLFDTSNQTFEQVNAWHQSNHNVNPGYPSSLGYYIGYHYFIEKSGTVRQGRLDTDEGAHTKGMNTTSLGICLAGNFDVTLPTAVQISALKQLLSNKSKEWNIPHANIVPHRRFAQKSCYGMRLGDNWAADLLEDEDDPRIPILTQIIALYKQIISMIQSRGAWFPLV
jgi:hypothetical protein